MTYGRNTYRLIKNKHVPLLDKMKIAVDYIECQTVNKLQLVSLDDFLQTICFILITYYHKTTC
jgi:hypothetical protein